MPVLSLISRNSPKQFGIVSPELLKELCMVSLELWELMVSQELKMGEPG